MRWSGRATMSQEHGGAPVATVATTKQNAAVPWVERWCEWVGEVEKTMVECWVSGSG